MQKVRKGLVTALLFLLTLGMGGCRHDSSVYTAGVEETVQIQTSQTTEKPAHSDLPETESGTEEELREPQPETAGQTVGYVHICGAVNCPGVYPIHPGMRLFEAIELAGGFSQEADETWLNQAQQLQDGQRWYVYTREQTQELSQPQTQQMDPAAQQSVSDGQQLQQADETDRVNLNTADKDTLMSLPGIGEARAEAIIQYRTEHGGFTAIEEIQQISGIKGAVYSKIEDRITV